MTGLPGLISRSSGRSWYFKAGFGAAAGWTVNLMTVSVAAGGSAATPIQGRIKIKAQTISGRAMRLLLEIKMDRGSILPGRRAAERMERRTSRHGARARRGRRQVVAAGL